MSSAWAGKATWIALVCLAMLSDAVIHSRNTSKLCRSTCRLYNNGIWCAIKLADAHKQQYKIEEMKHEFKMYRDGELGQGCAVCSIQLQPAHAMWLASQSANQEQASLAGSAVSCCILLVPV